MLTPTPTPTPTPTLTRWADIARYLPGRTDNAIKNHWNSVLRKGESVDHIRDEGGAVPSAFPAGEIRCPTCRRRWPGCMLTSPHLSH